MHHGQLKMPGSENPGVGHIIFGGHLCFPRPSFSAAFQALVTPSTTKLIYPRTTISAADFATIINRRLSYLLFCSDQRCLLMKKSLNRKLTLPYTSWTG
mmetsp:Transcript_21634/g.34939  ORF Transcript_21634/g.34939 Transcript_21634/m.34939 type:complete len:99 (-) Transcript_21634:1036-1332(-)